MSRILRQQKYAHVTPHLIGQYSHRRQSVAKVNDFLRDGDE